MEKVDTVSESRTDTVSSAKRFFWGMGGFTDHMIINGSVCLISVIYVNGMHYGAAMIGLAVALPRIVDAVSDPVIGYLSDNTRSKWGRRRPWMLFGLIVSALLTMVLWHPPVAPGPVGDEWLWPVFIYIVGITSLLYGLGYTSFNVPHIAMGYEMTSDYDERTHLFKWRQVLFSIAGFLSPWLLTLCMMMEGDKAQTFKGSHGIVFVSALVAFVIILSGLPSILFCRENVQAHIKETKVKFLDAVKLTLKNRPFWLIVISNFISKFCMAATGIFFVYIFLYHITHGDQKSGSAYLAIFFNAINISSLIAMPLVARLSDRIGKKRSLLLMLVLSSIAYFSLWFTFSNGPGSFWNLHIPFLGDVAMQWPSLITAVMIGSFTNTMPMINNSMLADVCDLDELNSGHRREAFYSAVFSTVDKAALGIAMGLQGVLLVASGFDSKLDLQPASVINFWIYALILSQPLGFIIAFFAIMKYPLSRERCSEIKDQLKSGSGV